MVINDLQHEIDSIIVPNTEIIFENTNKFMQFNWESNRINIVHQNIRSMGNLDDFLIFLEEIKSVVKFHVLILTECRLNDSYISKQLSGYNEYHTTSHINQNSGIVVYIDNTLNSLVQEININQCNCLKININENLGILAIYRSPSFNDIHDFLDNLIGELKKTKDYAQYVLIGDMNINTIGEVLHRQSDDYLCAMAESNFISNINSPTRVQDSSSSCLDHIYTRNITNSNAFVIHNTITDHYTTAISIPNSTPKKHKINHKQIIDYEGLLNDLNNKNWEYVYKETEVNNALNYFINEINTFITKHTITKRIPYSKIHLTPWITNGIVKSIHKRNHLHKIAKRDPLNATKQQNYYRYRNICKTVIRKCKERYYKFLLDKDNSSKNMWNVVRDITKSKRNTSASVTELNTGNLIITDNHSIACHTNQYFASVGSNLAKKILLETQKTEDSLASTIETKEQSFSFNIKPTTVEEVLKIINSLNTTHAKGPDSLNTQILKKIKNQISAPLSYIYNLSFTSGIFPDHFKKSIIVPIHKSGPKTLVENYRPISLLSAISKVIEKLFKTRLNEYVEEHNILSPNQYGFRSGKGTDDAIACLTETIAGNMNRGKKTIALFLDLAKAFDTISHKILLQRLRNIGIKGKAFQWIESYISNRFQQTRINEAISTSLKYTFGVPQGSTLGPLLFIIYINELCNQHIGGKIITFADDTVILFEGDDWKKTHHLANTGINRVKQWLDNNLLTLNIQKTKYLTFTATLAGQPKTPHHLTIHNIKCSLGNINHTCKCETLECVKSIKYLGIIVDNHLKWKQQIENTANKVRKLIYIFIALREIIKTQDIKKLYYGLCNSVLTYGCIGWGGTGITILYPLLKAQKSILRVIMKKPFRYSSDALFKEFNVLDVRQCYIKKITICVHKNKNKTITVDHNHQTRSKSRNDLSIPICNTAAYQKVFSYLGPKIYNKIPSQFKLCELSSFGTKITKWLLDLGRTDSEKLLKNVV